MHDDLLTALWTDMADVAAADGRGPEAEAFRRLAASAGHHESLPTPPSELADAPRRARFLVDVGGVWSLAGVGDRAEAAYRAALEHHADDTWARLGLANLRLPGPVYYEVLDRLHEWVAPRTYLEIGMGDGSSMALARPGTTAIGVDPVPTLCHPLAAECHVYPQTSDSFFARPDVVECLGGRAPDLVFIDGLHTFPAVFGDLVGVESLAGPDTVVVLHDTIPLDEPTQRPDRVHEFYTGDVWKLLPLLARERPDLDVFTIATPPSGLTVVTGLDPATTAWAGRHEELVERYDAVGFDADAPPVGDVVDNDWGVIRDRLDRARRRPGRTTTG
ncbi:MAG: class I SAM-dependent methyltransferase [Acidimicrobiales bacterium]